MSTYEWGVFRVRLHGRLYLRPLASVATEAEAIARLRAELAISPSQEMVAAPLELAGEHCGSAAARGRLRRIAWDGTVA